MSEQQYINFLKKEINNNVDLAYIENNLITAEEHLNLAESYFARLVALTSNPKFEKFLKSLNDFIPLADYGLQVSRIRIIENASKVNYDLAIQSTYSKDANDYRRFAESLIEKLENMKISKKYEKIDHILKNVLENVKNDYDNLCSRIKRMEMLEDEEDRRTNGWAY